MKKIKFALLHLPSTETTYTHRIYLPDSAIKFGNFDITSASASTNGSSKYCMLNNVNQTTTLNALIICNGWADSNDGNIGNNLQILIIEDDAKTFLENHITNWQ